MGLSNTTQKHTSALCNDLPSPGGVGFIEDENGGNVVSMDKSEVLHVEDRVIEREEVNSGTGCNVLTLPGQ